MAAVSLRRCETSCFWSINPEDLKTRLQPPEVDVMALE